MGRGAAVTTPRVTINTSNTFRADRSPVLSFLYANFGRVAKRGRDIEADGSVEYHTRLVHAFRSATLLAWFIIALDLTMASCCQLSTNARAIEMGLGNREHMHMLLSVPSR